MRSEIESISAANLANSANPSVSFSTISGISTPVPLYFGSAAHAL